MLQLAIIIAISLISILVSIWVIFKKAEKYLQNNRTIDATNLTELTKFIDSSTKSVTERLDQQKTHNESIPHHNSTFYFNAHGEAMNLNLESWAIDLETDLKELQKNNKIGVLTVFIRKNKIIFDKFVLDFKNFSEKHADYLIVQHGVGLMQHSELNTMQLHFEMLKEFVAGVHAIGTIYHNQATNLLIHSFIQHIKPLYEAEKARLEKVESDKEKKTMDVVLEGVKEAIQVDPEKKKEEINADVYSRAECPFEYCDDPDVCKSLDRCHHKSVPEPIIDIEPAKEATVYENVLVRAMIFNSINIDITLMPSGRIIYNGSLKECPTDLLTIDSVKVAMDQGKDEEDWIIVYEEKKPDSELINKECLK